MNQARVTEDDMRRMFVFFNELEEKLEDVPYVAHLDDEILGTIVKKHWGSRCPGVGASWRRVLNGMEVLLRTCTDPGADTLESQDASQTAENPGSES